MSTLKRRTILLHFLVLSAITFSGVGAHAAIRTRIGNGEGEPAPQSVPKKKSQAKGGKSALLADLNGIASTYRRADTRTSTHRLLEAERAAFQTLVVIVRCLDRTDMLERQLLDARDAFDYDYFSSGNDGARIAKGMAGIADLFSTMYRMHFENDTARMSALTAMNDSVRIRLRSGQPAIDALGTMSNNMYLQLRDLLRDIDTLKSYEQEFATVDDQYYSGVDRIEKPEDRFLNGIYRTYELCQLWIRFMDAGAQKDIAELNRKQLAENEKIDTIDAQLASAVTFLYRILDLVARETVKLLS
jgi:hypothetical protein